MLRSGRRNFRRVNEFALLLIYNLEMNTRETFTKFLLYSLISLFIVICTLPLWIKFVPTKYVTLLTGKLDVVDSVVCNFSVKVVGESMNPLIAPGSTVKVDRCFGEENLNEGTVIMFDDGSNSRFGIIRHVLALDPVVYKVSDEKASDLLHDVIKAEVIGIASDIDVSDSKYQAKQGVEEFILDADEFLSDFYLASIPRGMGIESSVMKEGTVFSRNEDKFCYVILPKKDLRNIDTEIIDVKTQEIFPQGTGIVFDASITPNINCKEFGIGIGKLDLDTGVYRYRLLMDHQVLADVRFEVR